MDFVFLENEELDEEALAMKAMGLPTSFTSSLVILFFFCYHKIKLFRWLIKIGRSKPHRETRSRSPGNETTLH
jgi:hypothetical protein